MSKLDQLHQKMLSCRDRLMHLEKVGARAEEISKATKEYGHALCERNTEYALMHKPYRPLTRREKEQRERRLAFMSQAFSGWGFL